MRRALALAVALSLGLLPAAFAQLTRGNVYGKVADESGAVLPGATVTLSGAFGTRSTVSDKDGEFRFLNLDHGDYKVTVALTGFANREPPDRGARGPERRARRSTSRWPPSRRRSRSPRRRPSSTPRGSGTVNTIAKDELAKIPTSRDPWALLRTVPGVMVDRVNIAGSESGQQSNFVGKGADPKDTVWTLDGVVITDMAAVGASPDLLHLRRLRRGVGRDRRQRHRAWPPAASASTSSPSAAPTRSTAAPTATSPTTTCSRRTCPTSWWATRGCRARQGRPHRADRGLQLRPRRARS